MSSHEFLRMGLPICVVSHFLQCVIQNLLDQLGDLVRAEPGVRSELVGVLVLDAGVAQDGMRTASVVAVADRPVGVRVPVAVPVGSAWAPLRRPIRDRLPVGGLGFLIGHCRVRHRHLLLRHIQLMLILVDTLRLGCHFWRPEGNCTWNVDISWNYCWSKLIMNIPVKLCYLCRPTWSSYRYLCWLSGVFDNIYRERPTWCWLSEAFDNYAYSYSMDTNWCRLCSKRLTILTPNINLPSLATNVLFDFVDVFPKLQLGLFTAIRYLIQLEIGSNYTVDQRPNCYSLLFSTVSKKTSHIYLFIFTATL